MSLNLRNRIIELRQMCPADLAVNARNFRRELTAQATALKGLLAEVGIADGLLAYPSARNDGTLTLIDGEERRERAPMEPWLTLILTNMKPSAAVPFPPLPHHCQRRPPRQQWKLSAPHRARCGCVRAACCCL